MVSLMGHKEGRCGVGMFIKLKRNHWIRMKMGDGFRTNTLAELLSFYSLLWFAKKGGFFEFYVMGD